MKRFVSASITIVISIFMISCAEPAGNSTNKPVTAANSANSANANAAAVPNPAAAEAEIKKLMDTAQTALAKNDADAMDKIYNDNYMLVNIDGSVQNRTERLAALRSGATKYSAFTYSEPNIRISPDGTGAVVIARLTMKGTFNGKPTDGDYRVTQLYSKMKDGAWKQISAQATKIEGGSAPGKTDEKKPANTAPASNAPANK